LRLFRTTVSKATFNAEGACAGLPVLSASQF